MTEPSDRLSDYTKIKAHKFFAGIDWDLASQRALPSPLCLTFKSSHDLKYFSRKRFSALIINDHEQENYLNDLSYNYELE